MKEWLAWATEKGDMKEWKLFRRCHVYVCRLHSWWHRIWIDFILICGGERWHQASEGPLLPYYQKKEPRWDKIEHERTAFHHKILFVHFTKIKKKIYAVQFFTHCIGKSSFHLLLHFFCCFHFIGAVRFLTFYLHFL